jgi:hypothetical protein
MRSIKNQGKGASAGGDGAGLSDRPKEGRLTLVRPFIWGMSDMGLTDAHFDHLLKIFKDTVDELHIPAKETEKMMGFLETMRDDLMDRYCTLY